ncbi:MAG: hypothetical protein KKD63_05155 [Proteobacteria bacterium]|nr:hypothetical protein [Pseudomonadota bacterium]MDP2105415.1 hypothetical protein [Desulfobulbaceae bacterium]
MMTIDQLKKNRDLVNSIDWEMTPEKAVDMYLEWGAGWIRGNDFVKSDKTESIYFVLYDWETPSQATLLKRTMKEAVELTKIPVPDDLFKEACDEDGRRPGGAAHRLNAKLINWLSERIHGVGLDPTLTVH